MAAMCADEATNKQADSAFELMDAARAAVKHGHWDEAEVLLCRLLQSVHDLRLQIRDKRLPQPPPEPGTGIR
jgi:hypothetical protein